MFCILKRARIKTDNKNIESDEIDNENKRINCSYIGYSVYRNKTTDGFKKEKSVISNSIQKFYQNSKIIDKSIIDQKTLSTGIIEPAKRDLVHLFPSQFLEFAAQLYVYYTLLVPNDEKEKRQKIVTDVCFGFFDSKELAKVTAAYIEKIGFIFPTAALQEEARSICGRVIWAVTVYGKEREGGKPIPYLPMIFKQAQSAAKAEYEQRNLFITQNASQAAQRFAFTYLKELKIKKEAIDEISEAADEISEAAGEISEAASFYVTRLAYFTSILPKKDANKVVMKNIEVVDSPGSYEAFQKFINVAHTYFDPQTARNSSKNQTCSIEFLEEYRKKRGRTNFDLEETAKAISEKFDRQAFEKNKLSYFTAAVEGVLKNCFHGPTIDETKICIDILYENQHDIIKAFNKTANIYLTKKETTVSKLYEELRYKRALGEDELFFDDDDKAEEKNLNEAELKQEKDADIIALDPLLAVSLGAGTQLQEFLEEEDEADLKEEKNEDEDEDEDEKSAVRASQKDTAEKPKATRGSKKGKSNDAPKRKKKKRKRTKTIFKDDNQPEEQMLSLGVLEGLDFRLEEINLLVSQLEKQKKNNPKISPKGIETLLAEAQGVVLKLVMEKVADTWKPEKLRDFLYECDDCTNRLREKLRAFVKKKTTLESFDEELRKAIKREKLIAGKVWGGEVDKVLDGQFYMIEAAYHGKQFDPGKKVIINGVERHLKLNEALTYYVTKSSSTEGYKYCISIRLWNLREEDEEIETRTGRLYSPGKNVDPKDRIDPCVWRYSGYTMAVLHIK